MAVNRKVKVIQDKEPPNDHPWKNPFLLLVIGSIGQGKTNAYINVLDELDNHYNRIVVFSGNKMDSKLSLLGPEIEIYGPNPEELTRILEEVITQQKRIKKAGKKIPPILLIFDDLISDKDFFPSTSKGNNLINFIISLRHFNTSVIITSQQYKLIPKKLRVNATMLMTFRLSDADFKDLLDETNFPKSVFKKAYNESTREKHSFLYVNLKTRQLIKNFDHILDI